MAALGFIEGVRKADLAAEHPQKRGVARFNTVDAERRRDQLCVLDVRCRAGVGGDAGVFELCTEREELIGILDGGAEVEFGFFDRIATEVLDGLAEHFGVGPFVLPDHL